VKDLVVHSENQKETVRVIGVRPNTLLTEEIKIEMSSHEGIIKPDKSIGVSKVAVLERHKGTGNVSVGFIKGFDYTGGAIASTVAHDSHNLVVMGYDESSMIRAIERVKRSGGGLVAVFGDKIESLPLPLGGLMSTENIEDVIAQHEKLINLISEMGFSFDPYPTLSFVALPVIPKLKITDKGLVDVEKFDLVNLFA
jgi:adenine deaminase